MSNRSVDRKRSEEINPELYFSDWHYKVERYHYPIFGVALREYVDREKSKEIRIKTGDKSLKIMRKAWSIALPKQYHFNEGDVFYSSNATLRAATMATSNGQRLKLKG